MRSDRGPKGLVKDKDISKVDVICDFLEVYLHAILHCRKLYPETLFEDRSAYGVPVKASRHPELNQYIADVVSAIRAEIKEGSPLGDVMIDIVDDDGGSIETFVLELTTVQGSYERAHDIELRSALIRMSTLEPALDLPPDATFRNLWAPRLPRPADGGSAKPPAKLVPLCAVDSAELKVSTRQVGGQPRVRFV